jgi:hypothetical protein
MLNAILNKISCPESVLGINQKHGERMFEVARYEHPVIFVTNRGTRETFKLQVRDDGHWCTKAHTSTMENLVEPQLLFWLEEDKPRKQSRNSY